MRQLGYFRLVGQVDGRLMECLCTNTSLDIASLYEHLAA